MDKGKNSIPPSILKKFGGKIMYKNYIDIKKRITILTKQLEKVEAMLGKFPDEDLICTKNGRNFKWYIRKCGKTEYLPKQNKDMAEMLAQKKYYELLKKDIECEIKASEAYIRKMEQTETGFENYSKSEMLLFNPGYYELLKKQFNPVNQLLQEWMDADYEKNPYHPENLKIKGMRGRMFRSKSEAMIDMMLNKNNIPFRYEEKLTVDGVTMYPDFTIRHPANGDFYYWEHFGMMDDEKYLNRECQKIGTYCRGGIIPSVNLITTYETEKYPLSLEKVEQIINEYFGV